MAIREHYAASNADSVTVTSNTVWGSACTLSPTLASGADYIVFWSLELVNQSNTTADAQARVTVDGTALATMNAEPRNTSEFPAYAGFFKITGAGSAVAIALEIKAETNGNNIVARNRRLTVLRMGADDVYVESTARQAVTAGGTTTFADVLSTTFTPAIGDYLVLGHSATDNYAATTSVYGRFVWDGTAGGTAEVAASGHAEVASGQKNLIPLNKQRVYSEATGGVSRTVTWQGRSHQNGMEAGFSQNRLLILRLADFSAYYPARLSELGWVEGNVATDVLALSPVPVVTSNPHLLLAAWSSNQVSNLSGYVYSRLDDADDDADAASSSSARVFNTADTRAQGAAFYGVRTYTAGSRPVSLKVWGGNATEWSAALGGSAFTLLDLGAEDAPAGDTVGSADGASTAAATGQAVKASAAGGTGAGTAAAVGLALAAAVASSAGVSTADATARAVKASAGASDGVGTAAAAGVAVKAAIGSAPSVGAASAQGASVAASVGASSGVGAASGATLKVVSAVGAASGASSVDATGAATSPGTYGIAAGAATTAATGGATAATEGVGGGYVAVDGRGASVASSVATAGGSSTAQGAAVAVKSGVGTGLGQSGGQAEGASTASSTGTGSGQASTDGVGESGNVVVEAVGTANSVGLAQATGRAILGFVGASGGVSVVTGISLNYITPASRTFVISADFRVMRVGLDVRTLKIAADKRPLKVLANKRMV